MWVILAALAATAILLGLGVWQLSRAQDKRELLAEYAARQAAPARDLALPIDKPRTWRYRHVRVTGYFDGAHQFLLDNQIRNARVGYEVLTPLKPMDGTASVLVNRGWVPLRGDRSQRPDIAVTDAKVTLTGTVYVPLAKPFALGPMAARGATGWPRRVQYLDFRAMGAQLGRALAPLTMRLDPASPYGYERGWSVVPVSPERHLGYAFQWFALAAAVVAMFVGVNLKRVASDSGERSG